jgi:lipocalin
MQFRALSAKGGKNMRDDFAVFILTHGRPEKVFTLNSLKAGNYSGKWYIVIDNEDDTEDEYRRLYGDRVLQFDKVAVSKTFDTAEGAKHMRLHHKVSWNACTPKIINEKWRKCNK